MVLINMFACYVFIYLFYALFNYDMNITGYIMTNNGVTDK